MEIINIGEPIPSNSRFAFSNSKTRIRKAIHVIKKIPLKQKAQMSVGILAGLVALKSILTDGSAKGERNAKEEMASFYTKLFMNADSSLEYSHLREKAKETFLKLRFDDPIYPSYVKNKNIILSTIGEVFNTNNAINLTAATGAVAAPLIFASGSVAGTAIGITCLGILAFQGAKFVLGLGKDGL